MTPAEQIYQRLWHSTRHSVMVQGIRCPVCWRAALIEAKQVEQAKQVHRKGTQP